VAVTPPPAPGIGPPGCHTCGPQPCQLLRPPVNRTSRRPTVRPDMLQIAHLGQESLNWTAVASTPCTSTGDDSQSWTNAASAAASRSRRATLGEDRLGTRWGTPTASCPYPRGLVSMARLLIDSTAQPPAAATAATTSSWVTVSSRSVTSRATHFTGLTTLAVSAKPRFAAKSLPWFHLEPRRIERRAPVWVFRHVTLPARVVRGLRWHEPAATRTRTSPSLCCLWGQRDHYGCTFRRKREFLPLLRCGCRLGCRRLGGHFLLPLPLPRHHLCPGWLDGVVEGRVGPPREVLRDCLGSRGGRGGLLPLPFPLPLGCCAGLGPLKDPGASIDAGPSDVPSGRAMSSATRACSADTSLQAIHLRLQLPRFVGGGALRQLLDDAEQARCPAFQGLLEGPLQIGGLGSHLQDLLLILQSHALHFLYGVVRVEDAGGAVASLGSGGSSPLFLGGDLLLQAASRALPLGPESLRSPAGGKPSSSTAVLNRSSIHSCLTQCQSRTRSHRLVTDLPQMVRGWSLMPMHLGTWVGPEKGLLVGPEKGLWVGPEKGLLGENARRRPSKVVALPPTISTLTTDKSYRLTAFVSRRPATPLRWSGATLPRACCKKLQLNIIPLSNSVIKGVGTSSRPIIGYVEITVTAKNKANSFKITALVIDCITDKLPSHVVDTSAVQHLFELPLADPLWHVPGEVELLLGAKLFPYLLLHNKILSPTAPSAVETVFGYILMGEIPSSLSNKNDIDLNTASYFSTALNIDDSHCFLSLDESLHKFWNIEEIPSKSFMSPADRECEQLYVSTVSRDSSGRYCAALPFCKNPELLGNSYAVAYRRLINLEKTKLRDPALRASYNEIIQDPFLAMRTVRQLSEDEKHRFPRASIVASQELYMDDLANSTPTVEEAKTLSAELIALFKAGGFDLTKWAILSQSYSFFLSNPTTIPQRVLDRSANEKRFRRSDTPRRQRSP
ncbi:hypothetical protein HW555_013177, partial [Spodoptera exigua]